MNIALLVSENQIMEVGPVEGYSKIAEAAKRLSVSTRTITRWIHKGYFAGVIKNDPEAETGSYYLIPDAAIQAFIERRKSAAIRKDDSGE